jgi:hypothetical protein
LTALLPCCVLLPPSCSVGRLKRPMAEMCVKAVLAVADLERRDVNLDLIKVGGGGGEGGLGMGEQWVVAGARRCWWCARPGGDTCRRHMSASGAEHGAAYWP